MKLNGGVMNFEKSETAKGIRQMSRIHTLRQYFSNSKLWFYC